jgi:hypothetical protein
MTRRCLTTPDDEKWIGFVVAQTRLSIPMLVPLPSKECLVLIAAKTVLGFDSGGFTAPPPFSHEE